MSAILYSDALGAARPGERSAPRARTIPKRWVFALVVGDILMFLLSSFAAAAVVAHAWNPSVNFGHVGISTTIFLGMWLAIFERLGLYRRSFAFTVKDELYYTVAALCMGIAPQFLAFTIVPSLSTSRAQLLLALVFSIVTVGVFRAVVHKAYDIASRAGRRIVVVGDPSRLDDAVETLRLSENHHVYWLAVRDLEGTLRETGFEPSRIAELGWFKQASQWHADQVIFTEMPPPDAIPHMLVAATYHNIALSIAPPRIRAHAYSMTIEMVGQQVLIVPRLLRACRPSARLFKRLFDVCVALVALLLFSPVMIAVALVLAFDKSGPILYKQERVGRNGRPFKMLKFRTMRADAEVGGARFAVKGDPRVTKFGRILRRTSMDELPQIINVLRGDMSVVGPRPERPMFVDRFRGFYPRYEERHLVKPGITGWSQVHMRRVMDPNDVGEKLKHDLFYVENWSPFLDLSVIMKTGAEFLFHRAA